MNEGHCPSARRGSSIPAAFQNNVVLKQRTRGGGINGGGGGIKNSCQKESRGGWCQWTWACCLLSLPSFLRFPCLPFSFSSLSPLPSLLEWTSVMRLVDVNFLFIYTIDKNHQTQVWLPVLAQRPPRCAGGQSPSVGTSDPSWGLVLLMSRGSKGFCLFLHSESHSKWLSPLVILVLDVYQLQEEGGSDTLTWFTN